MAFFRNKKNKKLVFLLPILIVFVVTGFFLFKNLIKVGAAWYDSHWPYRKSMVLSHPSGALTDYQMKIFVGQSADAWSNMPNTALTNTGFETGDPPVGWIMGGTGTWTRSDINAKSGAYSGELTNTDSNYNLAYEQPTIALGQSITFGAWVKTDGTAGGNAYLKIHDTVDTYSSYAPTDGNWHYVTMTRTLTAANPSVQLFSDGAAHSSYFDDASVVINGGTLINCDGNCSPDFSDLRFTTANGTTLLNYWIESISGTTPNQVASVWVKFDNIGTSATNFYMYYGNTSASSLSNAKNTMIIYEDMNSAPSGTLKNNAYYDPINKWVRLTTASGGIGGQLEYNLNPGDGFVANFNFWAGGGNGADATWLYAYNTATPTSEDAASGGYIFAYDEYNTQVQLKWNGTALATPSQGGIGSGTWHSAEIIHQSTNSKIYYDGTLDVNYDDSTRTKSGGLFGIAGRTGGLYNEHRINDLVVRAYASPEPDWGSLGSEETRLVVQKGPVGWWKMDGNAKDSTNYGNDGTVIGATLTTDRKGQMNKAYGFDGVSDYINLFSDGSKLGLISNATFEFWLKLNSQPAAGRIFGYASTWAQTGQWLFYQDSANIAFAVYQSGNQSTSYKAMDLTDGWHNFAGVWTGGVTTLYVDGVAQAPGQNIGVGNLNNADSIRISNNSLAMNGSIDDVRIYNRALSQAEITSIYQSYDSGFQISDLKKGLVGQWEFNGNAKDSSAYNNNGIANGTSLTADRKGQADKAYSFNGTTDDVEVQSNSSLSPTVAVTIGGWVYDPPLNPLSEFLSPVSDIFEKIYFDFNTFKRPEEFPYNGIGN